MISLPGAVGFSPNKQSSLLPHSQGYCLAAEGEGVQNLSELSCHGHWARPGHREGKGEQMSHMGQAPLEDSDLILRHNNNNKHQYRHARHSAKHFIWINPIFTIILWGRYINCPQFADKEIRHRERLSNAQYTLSFLLKYIMPRHSYFLAAHVICDAPVEFELQNNFYNIFPN